MGKTKIRRAVKTEGQQLRELQKRYAQLQGDAQKVLTGLLGMIHVHGIDKRRLTLTVDELNWATKWIAAGGDASYERDERGNVTFKLVTSADRANDAAMQKATAMGYTDAAPQTAVPEAK